MPWPIAADSPSPNAQSGCAATPSSLSVALAPLLPAGNSVLPEPLLIRLASVAGYIRTRLTRLPTFIVVSTPKRFSTCPTSGISSNPCESMALSSPMAAWPRSISAWTTASAKASRSCTACLSRATSPASCAPL